MRNLTESEKLREEFKHRATASWDELEGKTTNPESTASQPEPKLNFDLEEDITHFCNSVHPSNLRATLTEDWYHEPSGHIQKVLVNIYTGSETLPNQFIDAIRKNESFNKFILKPKYDKHDASPIPWFDKKVGKTFFHRKRYFEATCGAIINFVAGCADSKYYYTVKIQQS